MADIVIRMAVATDASDVARIYNHYVLNTIVTFDEETIPIAEMARRIEATHSAGMPWLVAEREAAIVGYAYAGKWKARAAYRFSAEVTAYVDPGCPGLGIGSQLYEKLLPMLEERGIHAVMGGIALPNDASVAFHEKFGFSKVAHFKDVGFKFNNWIDVGYWQLVLPGDDTNPQRRQQ
jgi:L-amino acid N-acyltransferase YncA